MREREGGSQFGRGDRHCDTLGIYSYVLYFVEIDNSNVVAEQIDETDIRKIPQIVLAESGSLIVPV